MAGNEVRRKLAADGDGEVDPRGAGLEVDRAVSISFGEFVSSLC